MSLVWARLVVRSSQNVSSYLRSTRTASLAALALVALTSVTVLAEPPSSSAPVRLTPNAVPSNRSPQTDRSSPSAIRPAPSASRPTPPRPLPSDAARGTATPAGETPLMDRALTENGRLPIVARGELRDEIKSLDINDRPHRPLHFYGNTVRRRTGAGTSAQ